MMIQYGSWNRNITASHFLSWLSIRFPDRHAFSAAAHNMEILIDHARGETLIF